MCLSLADLLQVTWLPLDSSTVLHMALCPFYPWLIFRLYIYQFFFVHSSVDGLFGCFHVLAIVMLRQCTFACLCLSNSVFLGYRPRSGPAGSYGSKMFTFQRHLHSVLLSGSYQATSHLNVRVCTSPQHLQRLLFVVFLLRFILTSASWYLFVVGFACVS